MMQYKRPGSIILDLNSLDEGLNFLVPADWWAGFLEANHKKDSHEDLLIPDSHPLAFFFEIGIIERCPPDLRTWVRSHQHPLRALNQRALKLIHKVNEDVEGIVKEGVEEGSQKRNRPFHEWWDMHVQPLGQSYNKVLLSPSIDRSAFVDLFAGFEWKVVSPRLYKLICQGHFKGKDEHYRDFIIGIPVFLRSENIAPGQNDMDYALGPQIKTTAYFYNTMGLKYAFMGSVEQDVTLDQMLRYLFEGLYKMAVHGFTMTSQCFRNQLRLLNKQAYCNFDDEDQSCARLKWQPFNKLFNNPPSDGVEVVELSSYSKAENTEDDVMEVLGETIKSSKPSKKQKRDQEQPESPTKTIRKRAGYHYQQQQKQKSSKFQRFKKNREAHPQLFQQVQIKTTTIQQPHFSTEEETPSVIIEEGGQQYHQIIFQSREENRIYYPIWRNYHSVHSLAKLADLKMNESLPLPFHSSNKKIVKTKEGKRVLITTSSNQLVHDQNGQMVEMDKVEMPQKGIPQQMIKQLQNLALQIRGQKQKMNLQLLIKAEELQAAKEKMDIQSRTCKNEEQELDDLDEVESREC